MGENFAGGSVRADYLLIKPGGFAFAPGSFVSGGDFLWARRGMVNGRRGGGGQ
jgi:hypothetical protein